MISADGKTVTITLTDDDSDNVTILLKHHLTPVTPDDPSDPNYDATHATSHEIIHYVDENGDQVFEDGGGELNFTRTVTIDDVTNEVVEYGEWTPVTDGEFPAVTSPDKDGYTPDYPEVDAQTPDMTDGPDGTVKDVEVTVTYKADPAIATITYVDDDDNGNTVTTDITKGKTDGLGIYTVKIPDGYEYVSAEGQTFISCDGNVLKIRFTADETDNATIHLKHAHKDVDPSDPDDPYYDATHDTATQIIHYVDQNGKTVFTDDKSQTLDYERTVTIDSVTGEITGYGDWKAVDGDEFGSVTSPDKPGYDVDKSEVSGEKPEITNGKDGKVSDVEETVTYTAEDEDATITYVDDDKNGAQVGDIVTVTGKTDDSTTYTVTIPDGYEYVGTDGGVVSADGKTVTITFAADDSDNVVIHLKHGHKDVDPSDPDDPYYDDTHTTSTEHIHYVDQDGKTVFDDNNSQTLDYERTVTIDSVTGEITGYGDWKAVDGDEFGSVTSPDKPGYDVDKSEVSGEKPEITNGKDGKVSDVEETVTYTAEDEDATITYVDDDKNGAQVGDIVTVTGKTDDSTTYTVTIPDGYEYVGTDGGVVSADGKTVTITFAADDSDNVVIHLKHGHKDVDPSDPDDPYYADTHATVTQTVHYRNGENGKQMQADTTNEVNFNRTVTIDSVTGEITHYGDWEAVGDDYFKDFDSPAFDGYFADVQHTSEVKGVEPEQGAVDDVTINYYATDQTVQPDDPKDNGDKVDPSNPNSPVYPAGVTDKDLNKTVTETIHYVDPETGKEVASDKTIDVHYTRVGHVIYNQDGTVKDVKYDDWVADGSFTDVDSPVVDGYFTDHSKAGAYTVGDNDDITNQGNFDTTVYYYKRDQPVDPSSPKNDGDKINPDDPFSPSYPDGVDYDDLNAEVKQEVHYVDQNGKELTGTYTITVHYTRTAVIHYDENGEVTGITYSDWDADGSFAAVQSPDIDGYFTLNTSVAGKTVTDPQNQADFSDTVIYYKTDQDVTPDDPKTPDTPVNPSDPDSPDYPDGVDYDDLNADVKETVHYVDENGNELAESYTKTVHYERTAHIKYDKDGNATVTYGDWTADGSFDVVQSPDVDGYFTLNKTVDGKTVTDPQHQADFEENVIYYPTNQDVTPDDPKTPDTPINPSDPDSPDYPDGVDYDDLNADVKETVHYVDENGKELAGSYTKTVHYERTAHVSYDQNGNATVTYSDWSANGSFDAVQSPEIDGYFTLNKSVAGKTVTDPQGQPDFNETVIYYKTNQDVTPDDPKTPDTPINPSDPDSPDYPDGVDYDDLNADVKETVHYVDENGKQVAETYTKTVHYTRTAHITFDQDGNATVTYSDWSADGSFDAVQSPDVDGYFTLNTSVAGKKVTDPQHQADFEDTVIYYKTHQDVTPDDPKTPDTPINPSDPDSPDYPDGVDYDDLNADVKETVHYVDENGKELAETYTKTVHYTRTAHVTFDKNGNATVTYSDWSGDSAFDAVQSPDVDGYFTLNTTVAGKTVTDPQKQADFEDTVIYYKSSQDVTPDDPKTPDTPINPSDPDSPDYPDGVDYDDLNADVKETVHYVDENGKELAGTYTKTVHYERTAHVSFDKNGNATVTYSDWSVDGSFDAVQSPEIDGYFTLNKTVAGKTVTDPQGQPDFNETVIYYKSSQDVTPDDPKTPDTPINPSDPDSPDYPDGVDYDDLNADVKETVHYVDENGKEIAKTYTKTVHYTRTAHVTFDQNGNATVTYSDWSADGSFDAVQSPDVDGYFTLNTSVAGKTVTDPQKQADFEDTVIYYKSSQDVTPDDPKTPDTPVNPSDPDSPDYPDGVDYDDLNADVKETVHYVDENGKELADTYTKTVHYTRTAHVTFDKNGNATVTYSDWSADGSFDAVQSPDVDGYFTMDASVAGKIVTDPQHQADFEDTVIYYKSSQNVTPDDPKAPDTPINPSDPNSPVYPDGVDEDDLNQDVTETIHYVDAITGEELADTYTKTVHYTRNATVNYDANGNATVTYSDWTAQDSFGAVDSPDIDGYVADQITVSGREVNATDNDFDITVNYYDNDQHVTPDSPKHNGDKIDPSNPNSPVFPAGVDESDLNKDVTETIHYVDENGNELADTYTKTVHYTRDAHVHYDADGNTTITYGDWVADGSFDAVNSPEIDGYVADQDVIAALDNPTDNVDIVVTYHHAEVAPTPAPKPAPAPTKTVTPAHVAKKAMQQQAPAKRLPQTGEEDNSSMSEVGILGLLAGSLGLFGLGKKRKRDGED